MDFVIKYINKFILLLRKGVYTDEYMDSWERFDETSLFDKEALYSSLNMEDIADVDYRHAKRVFKNLNNNKNNNNNNNNNNNSNNNKSNNNKNLGDLYVQSDTLLLADVFENFRSKCIEICELDPAHLLSAPGLA